ncbi:MAG: 3-dehydroquinate synthase [Deinococcaceae bacterium]
MRLERQVFVDPPYPVFFQQGLLSQLEFGASSAVLVYDSALLDLWVRPLLPRFTDSIALPSGEACKSLEVYGSVVSQLAQKAFPRDGTLVALGGGATTDLVGYVAASYMRGVSFYSIPTTLLAMVDAAVGGKTAVNLPEGKNLVGAFWQPKAVYMDPLVLGTLPDSVFKSGFSEMFKHSLIDANIAFHMFGQDQIGSDAFLLALHDSIGVKADIVATDVRETDRRAFLNLGHTLGHALEAASDYEISHGDAVAYGIHYAAHLSHLVGGEDLTRQTLHFLQELAPKHRWVWDWDDLLPWMLRDKKAKSGHLRFVLLRRKGVCFVDVVSEEVQQKAFGLFLKDMEEMP